MMTPKPMRLEHLIILCHAECDEKGAVTEAGREKMKELGNSLRKRLKLKRGDYAVLCARGINSKYIRTAQALLPEIQAIPYFELFANDKACDARRATGIIQSYANKVKVLIIVTGPEMVEALPHLFGQLILGRNGYDTCRVDPGEGFEIECRKSTCFPLTIW
jgi:hypothetical protein